jgi:hypothetical protein
LAIIAAQARSKALPSAIQNIRTKQPSMGCCSDVGDATVLLEALGERSWDDMFHRGVLRLRFGMAARPPAVLQRTARCTLPLKPYVTVGLNGSQAVPILAPLVVAPLTPFPIACRE